MCANGQNSKSTGGGGLFGRTGVLEDTCPGNTVQGRLSGRREQSPITAVTGPDVDRG